MSVWDGGEIEERFSLLLLEDGEYHFRDHNCQLLEPGGARYASRVCLLRSSAAHILCRLNWPMEGALLVHCPVFCTVPMLQQHVSLGSSIQLAVMLSANGVG